MQIIDLGAQLHASHILQTHDGSVGLGTNYDLAELLFRRKAALGANCVGVLLAWWHRLTTNLTRGIDIVLRLNRVDDFGDCDLELC